ncbi:VanZ family protein [Agrilactobacillus fermenti]|uniref:VanZ family protein n=1 Tax=Agrilactobacillus fermenti TaxID=2586909 RepID=UPI001E5283F5|nr:VanZ family protein [Agrilactobacillus fermenti]MCD2257017.1 VanZ family protein [Agrilactobacillus fermenti]
MIFLGPIYRMVATEYQTRINHFPLIRLIFYSLDKTIFYLLIFMFLRIIWQRWRHKRLKFSHELMLFLFVGYLLMLYFLTVFRGIYFPWQVKLDFDRSLNEINFVPLVETLKLIYGLSKLDFLYNLFGNILWFIPFGIGLPILMRRPTFAKVLLLGIMTSISIEVFQFLLHTGITDIDDVIFNTVGTVIGFGLYRLFKRHSL